MRDYQKECVEIIEENFKKHNKQLIQLPTGSGKTWIFSEYLAKNSEKALIICPSIELREQIIDVAKMFGIYSISNNLNDLKQNHVITSHSLTFSPNIKKIINKNYDHIVIDEAHHSQSPTYLRFLSKINENTKILGCTATPERLDGKSLLQIFERITYQKSIKDLILNGFLSDIEAYKIKTNNEISKRGAFDFRAIELRKLDNDSRNKLILSTYLENCKNKKTLIFCLNIEHAIKISNYLSQNSIRSAYIHGKMSKTQRKEILKKFKTGELQVLTNCQILTEGFDEPTIDALIIARPTASKSLYCQMVGRGLRKTENKNICYLYELTDNNHKICTFNVLCDKEPSFQKDYKPGTKYSLYHTEIENINFEDIFLQKEKFDLFINDEPIKGNAVDILQTEFYKIPATNHQKKILKSYEIDFYEEGNFLEAAFLIWKQKLKEKYGHN